MKLMMMISAEALRWPVDFFAAKKHDDNGTVLFLLRPACCPVPALTYSGG